MYIDEITEMSKAGNQWFANTIDLPRDDPRRKKPSCTSAISNWFSTFEMALSCCMIADM